MGRIVVVDDEHSQLRLWKDILERYCPEYEVFTFGNSREAMEYLLEKGAEVLFLDIRMPGMSGFELLSHLLWDDKMMVVIISAYNDFEYAQMAIRKGVDEYLLKPISRRDIEHLIFRIRNHMEKVKKEHREQEDGNRSFWEMYNVIHSSDLHWLILKWMEQPLKTEEKAKIQKLFFCQTGFITVVHLIHLKKIHKLYSAGYLQYFIVPSILQSLYRNFSSYGKILIGIGDWRKLEIIIISGDTGSSMYRQIKSILHICQEQVKRELGVEFAVGISNMSEDIYENVRECYRQAVRAFQYGYVVEGNLCQIYDIEMEEKSSDPNQYFDECLWEGTCWKSIGEEKLKDSVKRGLDAIQKKRAYIDIDILSRSLIYWIRNGARSISDFYKTEKGNDIIHNIEYNLLGEENIPDLCKSLIIAIEQIFKISQNDSATDMAELMNRCRLYLKEHCSEQISLTNLSEYVHFSPSYISSMFKSFMGIGYKEYLTRIRMKKACKMLKDSNLKVYEIAIQSGYNDYISFVKSFKKEIGITPQKYRMIANECREPEERVNEKEIQIEKSGASVSI